MKLHITTCAAIFTFLASLITHGTAYPTPATELIPRASSYNVDVIYEFPKGTWVENLAVRENGEILATLLSTPEVFLIDPQGLHAPVLIHQFQATTGCAGIVEASPDVFYVVTGNFSFSTFESTPGSWSVWSINMTTFVYGSSAATVTKVADFPNAVFLNGATALSLPEYIIVADSGLGAVWRLNVLTGQVTEVIQDPTMAPTSFPAFGINGVKIRDNILYFTNTNTENFVSIPINLNGTAAGSAKVVASGISGLDDFIFDKNGDAFLALGTPNELGELPAGETTPIILVGSPSDTTTLAGPTACEFGRTASDSSSLYISSTGGQAGYSTGNFTVGGRISRVQVGVQAD